MSGNTKDMLIGTLTGISAVMAMALLSPRPAPPSRPIVREVLVTQAQLYDHHAAGAMPSIQTGATGKNLEMILEKVEMKRVPLAQAVPEIAQMSRLNIMVDWQSLSEAQIGDDFPVKLNLHNVPARVALQTLVDQLGAQHSKVAYRVTDEIVRISTVEQLSRELYARVYDVRDLIDYLCVQNDLTEREAADRLIEMIQKGVSPASWDQTDGHGTATPFAGRLIVKQTLENHRELIKVLAAMRQKRDKP
jgi:hypothetical protein